MTGKKYSIFLISFFSLIILLLTHSSPQKKETLFEKKENAWRAKRDAEMRSPTSWLTIAGLFWLDEGEYSFGSAATNKIKLPPASAPPRAGKFIWKKDKVAVVAHEGVVLKVDGKAIKKIVLRTDQAGKPDKIELGDLRMWVIERDNRYAVRLSDLNHPPYKDYQGLDFFPPTKKFQVVGVFRPHDSPQKVTVPTMIGTQTELISVGVVDFRLESKHHRLVAFRSNAQNTKLFFIFKDETNGRETYEASRFMTVDVLDNGRVDLNFNRAHNPPCAYTLYATCPLPPPQNYLTVRIEAGEKKYPGKLH
jgi:hypothetical protein